MPQIAGGVDDVSYALLEDFGLGKAAVGFAVPYLVY
jgi:hypothetical protein